MYDHVPTKFERRRRLFFKCKHSCITKAELHNPDIECRCHAVESLAGGAGMARKLSTLVVAVRFQGWQR